MELLLLENEEVIQAFSPHTPQKTFTDRIRLGGSIRCSKHFDPTGCGHLRKTRPKFAIIIPNEICGSLAIRSRFPQLLPYPGIGRRSRHIHVDHLPRLQFDDEKGEMRTEEEVRNLQKITSPHLCCMIVQERFPGLSTDSCWAGLPHILLNRPFTHPDLQFK